MKWFYILCETIYRNDHNLSRYCWPWRLWPTTAGCQISATLSFITRTSGGKKQTATVKSQMQTFKTKHKLTTLWLWSSGEDLNVWPCTQLQSILSSLESVHGRDSSTPPWREGQRGGGWGVKEEKSNVNWGGDKRGGKEMSWVSVKSEALHTRGLEGRHGPLEWGRGVGGGKSVKVENVWDTVHV